MMNEIGHSSSKSRERYFWRKTFPHLKSWKRGGFKLCNVVNLSSEETDHPSFPANHFSAYPEKIKYEQKKYL